jgi:hypothetical protein
MQAFNFGLRDKVIDLNHVIFSFRNISLDCLRPVRPEVPYHHIGSKGIVVVWNHSIVQLSLCLII